MSNVSMPKENSGRKAFLLFCIWSLIIGFSLQWNIKHERQTTERLAINDVNTNMERVLDFRRWIASHGGIYAKVDETLPPNPALTHLSERDVITPSGKQLTLVNTPYLLRQLIELYGDNENVTARMISSTPLNPFNMPDKWEKTALTRIKSKNDNICEIVEVNNTPVIKELRPVMFENSCYQCHMGQDYKAGDVYGAVSVSVPMQPYLDEESKTIEQLKITHGSIWFLGLMGIGFLYRHEKNSSIIKQQYTKSLKQSSIVFESTKEAIMITDHEINIIDVNRAFTELTGYTRNEVLGKNPNILKSEHHDTNFFTEMYQSLNKSGHWVGEIWNRRKNGEAFPVRMTINTVKDENDITTNYIGLFSDISEFKHWEDSIKHLAHHDSLTDLPNRILLNDRLNHAINQAEREHTQIAILFLDLDRFKNINDSLGHHYGDKLIVSVANKLQGLLRSSDTFARIGGDEFVIIVERIKDFNSVNQLADKLLHLFESPFQIEENQLHIGTSIGISIYPDNGNSVDELIKNADIAMYRAKEKGRGTYEYYSNVLGQDVIEKVTLENELHNALENNELILYFQPQVSFETGKPVGIETLLRWHHPEKGLIMPMVFIPLVDSSGLSKALTEYVLRKACLQALKWHEENIETGPVSINVSSNQILISQLYEIVKKILDETNCPAEYIELEITEDFLIEYENQPLDTLNKIKELGVSLSVDDFGVGYSSLSHLKHIPINKLKIDKSFVRDLPDDENDKTIIKTIISLGKNMNLDVVAEGVENIEQMNCLKELGCAAFQGYITCKPAMEGEVIKVLKSLVD